MIPESPELLSAWVQALAAVVQALFVVPATIIALVTLRRSSQAARRAATLDVLLRQEMDPAWKAARYSFARQRDAGAFDSAAKVHALPPEMQELVITRLEFYEILATMTEGGAADEAILRHYYGDALQRDVTALRHFIERMRKTSGSSIYETVERLAARWRR